VTDSGRTSAGVRAIVLYKTVKSIVELAVLALALALWPFGLPVMLHQFALGLHQHAAHGWAVSLASWLEQDATTARGVELSLMALGADGALTGIEAWALGRGHGWGLWLVVLATGALLPFEVYELVQSPRASRALLLTANAGIVAYLARRARHEGDAQASAVPARSPEAGDRPTDNADPASKN